MMVFVVVGRDQFAWTPGEVMTMGVHPCSSPGEAWKIGSNSVYLRCSCRQSPCPGNCCYVHYSRVGFLGVETNDGPDMGFIVASYFDCCC